MTPCDFNFLLTAVSCDIALRCVLKFQRWCAGSTRVNYATNTGLCSHEVVHKPYRSPSYTWNASSIHTYVLVETTTCVELLFDWPVLYFQKAAYGHACIHVDNIRQVTTVPFSSLDADQSLFLISLAVLCNDNFLSIILVVLFS